MSRGRWAVLGWVLLGAVAVAAIVMLTRPDAPDPARRGPLLPMAPQEIVRVEQVALEGRHVLSWQTGAAQWALTGPAADFVHAPAVEAFLATVAAATVGPVIPGTEARDPRYGFGGPAALEMVIAGAGGRTVRFEVGDVNPVTGLVYVTGAGRPAVFTVARELRQALESFPTSVRLPTLLPVGTRHRVTALRVSGLGGTPRSFVQHAGRWWLQAPQEGLANFSRPARTYHDTYGDRRVRFAGHDWYLASRRALESLLYEVTESPVLEFPAAALDEAGLAAAGLEPPRRRAELVLAGGDTTWTVDLGEPRGQRLWARREGRTVVTDASALGAIELPTSDLLDLGALSFRLAAADSFQLDGPSGPVLHVRRAPGTRAGWRVTVPPGLRLSVAQERADLVTADLVVDLDRLPTLAVLPPLDRSPVAEDQGFRLRAWGQEDGLAGMSELCFGPALPEIADLLAGEAGTPAAAVVHQPSTGWTLQVPGEILVTYRALRPFYR
ncbi:MAG: DUF4340 domain-containing protein [Candidatus Krumholzibacteriia bacterium]